MANYYAHARSNYFHVKDTDAFEAWAGDRHIEYWTNDEGRYAICPNDFDDAGWPSSVWNSETGEPDEFDLADELVPHLADGEVAVLMEVGNEKLRYVSGVAIALNNRHEIRKIHLSDIYDMAEELGPNVTTAEY